MTKEIDEHVPGSPYNSVEYYPPGFLSNQTGYYPPGFKQNQGHTQRHQVKYDDAATYKESHFNVCSPKEWACVASVPPALTKYYAVGGIEVIDYIKAKLTPEQYKGYLLGNIYKYSGRLQYKGDETKDIAKLAEYTDWLKEHNVNNT